MTKAYSANFKEKTGSTSGEEPVYLLEITHPQLAQPVRVVRDTEDIVSNGETFVALNFDIQLPDDLQGKLPRAPIRIDNVGRELTQWIDESKGGRGAQVRVMQVMRDDPDTLEYDVTMDLLSVRQNGAHVTGELGYEDTLNLPALAMTYRPDNTPGIF
ncbi:MAG: DUF1833 family protein [Burkholderiales bacterium]|nr:DUF1833 family protein [Burkholderiales bacterium]MDP2398852.1 DUF1833 family protein [Burkholderiales bacterium]MDP3715181.1 DUF1833 family protein [Burkholderiales bacterium]